MTKYSAKRTDCGAGHTHDSKAEALRCDALRALQATGNISGLEQQPEFPVEVNGKRVCLYKADFAYFVADCQIVEDVKGMLTPVYRLKKKLVEAVHSVVITEYPPRKRKARKSRKAAT